MTALTSKVAIRRNPSPDKVEFKPIRINRRQLALMIRVADFFHPDFAKQVGEPQGAIDLYADLVNEGCPATRAILEYFNLNRDGKGGYVWNPR